MALLDKMFYFVRMCIGWNKNLLRPYVIEQLRASRQTILYMNLQIGRRLPVGELRLVVHEGIDFDVANADIPTIPVSPCWDHFVPVSQFTNLVSRFLKNEEHYTCFRE